MPINIKILTEERAIALASSIRKHVEISIPWS